MSLEIKKTDKKDNVRLSKNFKVLEFACKGKGCCNEILWAPELIERLQWMRDQGKGMIVINSGYRCKTHNKRVGGVDSSKHTLGMAADLRVPNGVTLNEFAALAESAGFRGVLKYTDSYFVHVDLRESKPYYAVTKTGGSFKAVATHGGKLSLNPGVKPKSTLRKGSSSVVSVLWLQFQLKKSGFDPGALDGIYGNKTFTAVKCFQAARGLKADGICGTGETIPALSVI